mmetsp:Transcript_129551/g.375243  ORF Transcript_129551/g.375243 Transcript_129551/m.375243 type:complete len:251 (+) Transcript_129551:32-784(+)
MACLDRGEGGLWVSFAGQGALEASRLYDEGWSAEPVPLAAAGSALFEPWAPASAAAASTFIHQSPEASSATSAMPASSAPASTQVAAPQARRLEALASDDARAWASAEPAVAREVPIAAAILQHSAGGRPMLRSRAPTTTHSTMARAPRALGEIAPSLASRGSAAHGSGECRPCIYFIKQVCTWDVHCGYCHAEHTNTHWKRERAPKHVREKVRACHMRQQRLEQEALAAAAPMGGGVEGAGSRGQGLLR